MILIFIFYLYFLLFKLNSSTFLCYLKVYIFTFFTIYLFDAALSGYVNLFFINKKLIYLQMMIVFPGITMMEKTQGTLKRGRSEGTGM